MMMMSTSSLFSLSYFLTFSIYLYYFLSLSPFLPFLVFSSVFSFSFLSCYSILRPCFSCVSFFLSYFSYYSILSLLAPLSFFAFIVCFLPSNISFSLFWYLQSLAKFNIELDKNYVNPIFQNKETLLPLKICYSKSGFIFLISHNDFACWVIECRLKNRRLNHWVWPGFEHLFLVPQRETQLLTPAK